MVEMGIFVAKLLFDVSISLRYGFNTGIQKVVFNLGESLIGTSRELGYEIKVVDKPQSLLYVKLYV